MYMMLYISKFFCSVAQSCPNLCSLRDFSTLGFSVLHLLLEFAQTHVHWVGDATQPSHPLLPLLLLPSVFPSIRSFPVGWLFASSEQGIRALASLLPMNIQDWSPLGLTDLISLQSRGFSRVLSSTTIWKHQFFGAQPSLWSNSHTGIQS